MMREFTREVIHPNSILPNYQWANNTLSLPPHTPHSDDQWETRSDSHWPIRGWESVSPSWSLPRSEHLKLSEFHASLIFAPPTGGGSLNGFYWWCFNKKQPSVVFCQHVFRFKCFFPHSLQRSKCFDTTCKCIHFVVWHLQRSASCVMIKCWHQ